MNQHEYSCIREISGSLCDLEIMNQNVTDKVAGPELKIDGPWI